MAWGAVTGGVRVCLWGPTVGVLLEVIMALRSKVRDAQRAIAALDDSYGRALARLDQAVARRAEVMSDADRRVSEAQDAVTARIAEMAAAVSVDLTAQILDLDVAEVRRCVKARRVPPTGPDSARR